MGYYYTRVPVCRGPDKLYNLAPDAWLAPFGRTDLPDYPGLGATTFFDHILFISGAEDEQQHINSLRRWVLFHAFLLDDYHLCHFFETGRLHPHECVESLADIPKATSESAYPCDFDNVSDLAYFMHAPDQSIVYRDLWGIYSRLAPDDLQLIRTLLFQMDSRRSWYIQYDLFPEMRGRWQVTNDTTILEAIIRHAENCPESEKICGTCGRQVNPHRGMSEDQWRRQYLYNLGIDSSIIDDYANVMHTAHKEIRSKTAHPGGSRELLPKYPSVQGTQVYGISRSTQEYQQDLYALDSLQRYLHSITRHLLLHRVFDLSVFPEL